LLSSFIHLLSFPFCFSLFFHIINTTSNPFIPLCVS
jgi:hypothetical protein